MSVNLKGRNFLTLKDFTKEEISYLLDLSADLKAKKKNGELVNHYIGKNIALIFEKTSTRTRCSFEVAAHDMGMGVTYLDPQGSQIGKKESIADTARVLGRMFDGIEYRGFEQEIVEDLAKYARDIVSEGNQTGEGWFLTGEMLELIHTGTPNIVCTQPFACLPNHVVGKGVIKELRHRYPDSNIVAIDYDPGASEVNQLNRIKLMLSTAFKNLEKEN